MRMRAPNGEIAEVPDSEVEHYTRLGATIEFPGAEAGPGGLETPGLGDPGLLDPLNYAGLPSAGRAAARTAIGGLARGVTGMALRAAGLRTPGQIIAANPQVAAPAVEAATGAARPGFMQRLGQFVMRKNPVTRKLEDAADLVGLFRGGAGEAAESGAKGATEAVPTGIEKLRQMKPLRANASAGTKQQHLLEMEQAMAEAKLPEPAKKRLLAQMGHGPQKPFRPGKTKLEVVEGGKGKAPLEGMAERAKAKVPERPRHDVRYYSKSRGEHIDIEGMNQKHLEQAFNQLAKTNPKPGSVARKQMDALLEEAKHRYKTTDIHIGQGGQK